MAQERPRTLVDPGGMLARTHEVGGGMRVRLRLTRPSDAVRVRSFLERLSPESRRRRFFTAMPVINHTPVRHFTYYNPRERLVVAATAHVGGTETIVGIADVSLLSTGLAEIGLVVGDEHQARGVGALLSEAIASLAVQQGAGHLKAEMLERGGPMLSLMRRLGPTVETFEDGAVVAHTRLPARHRYAA